ncbi:unnamed protein product [Wuchereria bancrofti]|uniref:Uncharacterized protein n=2 Tax=Wuchereria bancrofti TaxID=6293 RepID=A0A3P7EY74_WUCBA|nr:unnamed protein product [Wuchereria bancrofti]
MEDLMFSMVFQNEFNWYSSGKYKTGSACQISKDNGCEVWEEKKQRKNCGTDSTQSTGSFHRYHHHLS